MPREGVFARVLKGGTLTPGLSVEILHAVPRSVVQAAVVTVSDRCTAGLSEDTSGPAVARKLEDGLAAHIAFRRSVEDDVETISALLRKLCDRSYDLICTVGGTGLGPRDVTPEATRAVIQREATGLAEAMRTASLRSTPHAMLQRGVCGVLRSTLIVNLPGSPKGAIENLEVILEVLPHAVQLLRGHTSHAKQDLG
jgi:molybdenum cofactor synthesis domain-containing protein